MHAPGSLQIAPYISLNLAVSGASAKAAFLFTARARVQGTLPACAGMLSTLRLVPEFLSTTEASYRSIAPQVKASFGLSFSSLYLLIHLKIRSPRILLSFILGQQLVWGFTNKNGTILAGFLGQHTLFQAQTNPGSQLACASRCTALRSPTEVYKG